MMFVFFLIFIVFCLLLDSFMSESVESSVRTRKVTEGISKLLLYVPAIVMVIFAFLLSFVLKGRFVERSSHALIVLCLWLYGTVFYVNVLKFFTNKKMLAISILGMILSVLVAIFLTPLDRYCEVLFASIHEFSYVAGGVMLAVWYFVMLTAFCSKKRVRTIN
ncbi:hypothetical protein [Butyrivibrio sp. NC3005]|uniref:hypothetical protein n=1 Tax=Butyrivibrio sp. NC3005 TaxID=1280685 RepID=UPI00040F7B79|nr:hypothetical protein [Butyrivibrio sp. NC3005]